MPRDDEQEYRGRGYTAGEVEILLKINSLELEVRSLKEMADKYVTRQEFDDKFGPVQKLVYGVIGVIVMAVVGAVVALVLR